MTRPVLLKLFFVVNARANYFSVFFCVSRYDATRAVTLAELLLPGSKALYDLVKPFLIGINVNTFFFSVSLGPVFYLLGPCVDVHSVTALLRPQGEAQDN